MLADCKIRVSSRQNWTDAHMNSQRLWLLTQKLNHINPQKISKLEEGNELMLSTLTKKHWDSHANVKEYFVFLYIPVKSHRRCYAQLIMKTYLVVGSQKTKMYSMVFMQICFPRPPSSISFVSLNLCLCIMATELLF